MSLRLNSERFFSSWFGLGVPPFLAGAVLVALSENLWLGLIVFVTIVAWYCSLGSSTCRSCTSHGTARCGLPGLVAPLFGSKRRSGSLPFWRIRLQYSIDITMLLLLNGVYGLSPFLLPAALVWTAVTWWIVFRPKRFHGQFHRLKQEQPQRKILISLPVVDPPVETEAGQRKRTRDIDFEQNVRAERGVAADRSRHPGLARGCASPGGPGG
jgi:hypothetical protein